MKIEFRLDWVSSHPPSARDFKLAACHSLLLEYVERIRHFTPCEALGALRRESPREGGTKIWLCEAGKDAQTLSSEELAIRLARTLDSGTKCLQIVLGGADGVPKQRREEWGPDLLWSFGPLTFPHELAVVIAAEQTYRAWTILRRHPYHLGH